MFSSNDLHLGNEIYFMDLINQMLQDTWRNFNKQTFFCNIACLFKLFG